jgi:WD40 repeat protein
MVQTEPLAGNGQRHRRGADDVARRGFDRPVLHLSGQEPPGRPGQSANPVVGHEDGELAVYDLKTGRPGPQLRVPAPPCDLVFRADGTEIAVVCVERAGRNCRILDIETRQLVRSISLPPGGGGVAWSPDGSTLATPSDDRKIYLWDALTGARRATLEGHISGGIVADFDPSGLILASTGWEGRWWLWDPVLGRPWLNMWRAPCGADFGRDGRRVVGAEDKLTTYQVDPALEYRTLAHAASPPLDYQRVSIHRNGRLLALGTDGGVVLRDVISGRELAFLPVGLAWLSIFGPSGDLLTSGSIGVWRWPVQAGRNTNDFRIGPPRKLPLPPSHCDIEQDRSGQIVALACQADARVLTPERSFSIGPLDDCRSVSVSPDGRWLATGSHASGGVRVWRIQNAKEIIKLPNEVGRSVLFSPDGKWLLTQDPPCRLWSVGTWKEARQIGGVGFGFSPDSRILMVGGADKALRLVETETGRTLARLESPDLCASQSATFSPDGSRLVVSTNDGPAVHVWDLRAIRKHLAKMALDWNAPPYSDDDPTGPSALPLPTLKVDYGQLGAVIEQQNHLEQNLVPAEDLVARYTERLKAHPDDADALHQRGRRSRWVRPWCSPRRPARR